MIKRLMAFMLFTLLAACGDDGTPAGPTGFEQSLALCRVDTMAVRDPALGQVYYTIIGRDETTCRVEMTFIDHPNESWIDQPLEVRLGQDRSAEGLKRIVTACIEGQQPQISDGSCGGPLLARFGHVAGGGGNAPQISDADFSQSGCGTVYAGPAPVRLRMRSAGTGLWGYLDENGRWAIAPQFDQATAFSEGLAAALKDGTWHIIAPDGTLAIQTLASAREQSYTSIAGRNVYQSPVQPFSDNCARLSGEQGKFYLSRDGQLWLDAPTPSMQAEADKSSGSVIDIGGFANGLGSFHVDVETFGKLDPHGYIDGSGTAVIAAQFAQVTPFDPATGLAAVGVAKGPDSPFTDGWIYIDASARKVLPKGTGRYKNAAPFSDGLAAVRIGRDYQYINADGEIAIEERFENAFAFSNGIAYVRGKDDAWAWIDKTGARIAAAQEIGLCDSQWPQRNPFQDGFALVIVAKADEACGKGGATTLGGGAAQFDGGEFAYLTPSGTLVFRESQIAQP